MLCIRSDSFRGSVRSIITENIDKQQRSVHDNRNLVYLDRKRRSRVRFFGEHTEHESSEQLLTELADAERRVGGRCGGERGRRGADDGGGERRPPYERERLRVRRRCGGGDGDDEPPMYICL